MQIVAELCHAVNHNSDSKHIAITLGANRAPIDSVRAIQNASSGMTGWYIAEYMYRFGHIVTVIAGKTSANPSFDLPTVFSVLKSYDLAAGDIDGDGDVDGGDLGLLLAAWDTNDPDADLNNNGVRGCIFIVVRNS